MDFDDGVRDGVTKAELKPAFAKDRTVHAASRGGPEAAEHREEARAADAEQVRERGGSRDHGPRPAVRGPEGAAESGAGQGARGFSRYQRVRQIMTGLSIAKQTSREIFVTSMCIGSGMDMAVIFLSEQCVVNTLLPAHFACRSTSHFYQHRCRMAAWCCLYL